VSIFRHAAEEHVFARDLMESVNHHLRTPLTVVLCHAELLTDRPRDLPPEVHAAHAAVLRAARRLEDVVLGVSELLSVFVEPKALDRVDVTQLVEDEVRSFRDRAAQRGVRFLSSGDCPQTCLTDARRLRRALGELLDNAVTYAPEGSDIRVASVRSAAGIRIEVRDQGCGIAPADRERLVRPFERGAHPGQPVEGRGMGLAMVAVVAASLGGRMLVSDDTVPGFQVCLELPVS